MKQLSNKNGYMAKQLLQCLKWEVRVIILEHMPLIGLPRRNLVA